MEDHEPITLEQKVRRLSYTDLPAVWWATMENRWPEHLGEIPENLTNADLRTIQEIAIDTIGVKACYRYMNVHHGFMTDQMFNDWWDSFESRKYKFQHEMNPIPQGLREQGSTQGREYGDSPIVTALLAFFFGGLGGVISRLLLDLLKLF